MNNKNSNGAPAPRADRSPNQEEIARRSYALWQDAGAPEGVDRDHWLQAERELSASLRGSPAPVSAVPAPEPAAASTTPYSASGSSSVSGQGATSSGSGLGSAGGGRSS